MPPRDCTDVARLWLRWADEDLALAEHTAADPDLVARGACVWAHQSAEKALKALLILRDIDPPKLHDLDRLAHRLPDDEGKVFVSIELPWAARSAGKALRPGAVGEGFAVARGGGDDPAGAGAGARDAAG